MKKVASIILIICGAVGIVNVVASIVKVFGLFNSIDIIGGTGFPTLQYCLSTLGIEFWIILLVSLLLIGGGVVLLRKR